MLLSLRLQYYVVDMLLSTICVIQRTCSILYIYQDICEYIEFTYVPDSQSQQSKRNVITYRTNASGYEGMTLDVRQNDIPEMWSTMESLKNVSSMRVDYVRQHL